MSANGVFIIDDGSLLYEIKSSSGVLMGSFRINPTDLELFARAEEVAEKVENIAALANVSADNLSETIEALKREIHEVFDFLLGYKASDELFAGCSALTLFEDGDWYFEKVLAYVTSIIEEHTQKRIEKKLNKVRSVTAKYKK